MVAPISEPFQHRGARPRRTDTSSWITLQVMSRYPASLSPVKDKTPSPLLGSKFRSRPSRREPSGVFSLFSTTQIRQFKEAFSMIDQDGDGVVTEADLKGIFTSLGTRPVCWLYTSS